MGGYTLVMGRIVGALVVIVVLYAIVTQPAQSASTTRNGASKLADAGHQMTVFLSSLVTNVNSSSSQVRYTPAGAAAAGDGSSQR